MKRRLTPADWTIRAKISISVFFACSAALLLMSVVVYVGFRRGLFENFDDFLRAQATQEARFIDTGAGSPSLQVAVSGDDLTTEDAGFVQLYDKSARLMMSDTQVPATPEEDQLIRAGLQGRASFGNVNISGSKFRVLVRPVIVKGQVQAALIVGSRQDSLYHTLNLLGTLLVFAAPTTSALLAIVAYIIASRTLRPIRDITVAAENIAEGDLSQRISVGSSKDEVGELAVTFNRMIQRLDETLARERRFTGDASHELRTPLTAMEAALDVTLSQERTPEQYRAVLTSLHKRTGQLIRVARQLLLLSRLDAHALQEQFISVDVPDLLTAVVESFSYDHPSIPIELHSTKTVHLMGDPELLVQAFHNLLENSAVHAEGAAISVEVKTFRNEVSIEFSDNGPGIPEEHLPNIMRRFERGASNQTRPGAGLGLAIVESVVQCHQGRLLIASSSEGTSVTIVLPLARPKSVRRIAETPSDRSQVPI